MSNSRLFFKVETLNSVSNNKNTSSGVYYKPGFVDEDTLESIKMAVDKELSSISNSFYRVSELLSLIDKRSEGVDISLSSINTSLEILGNNSTELYDELSALTERVEIIEEALHNGGLLP